MEQIFENLKSIPAFVELKDGTDFYGLVTSFGEAIIILHEHTLTVIKNSNVHYISYSLDKKDEEECRKVLFNESC